ncbi:zeatin O-glucosyltransferase-like [Benincasa hispida]|uniref:zeatin O-glucosyltransferase-like n=1 Tax=Benincasa hispida TaxID=102211 RepID=UPI0018FFB6D2|nr:zeatin O-glucosyltransferase-like [Benincasa hispida]
MSNQNNAVSTNVAKNSHHLPVVVVMVPLPAQGHLNQLLHLSRLLSAFNIPVHFLGTATHNRQAQLRSGGECSSHMIQFHDFDIPIIPSPSPNPNATHKFPSHLIPTFTAAAVHLRRPLAAFLRSLSSKVKRLVVIHDSLMSSAVQVVDTIFNVESYNFHSISPFVVALQSLERKGIVIGHGCDHETMTFYEEYFLKKSNVRSLQRGFPAEALEFMLSQLSQLPKRTAGKIYNTSRLIEGLSLKMIERVEHEFHHWALGPFNPVKNLKNGEKSSSNHACLSWLDRQEPRSVMYVSFGTTTAMDDKQIEEISIGLARSHQKFIWVLRDADKGDIFHDINVKKFELEEGYKELIGDRGLVIREWAPQLEILNHWTIGGFMTHCGWNSCMESMTMGVPMATWPMHSDQPRNAVLMTKVLRVGLVVKEWERGEEVVVASTVEEAVKRLIVSKEGAEIRRNAERLGEALRRSLEDGGDSRRELEAFVTHITSLTVQITFDRCCHRCCLDLHRHLLLLVVGHSHGCSPVVFHRCVGIL